MLTLDINYKKACAFRKPIAEPKDLIIKKRRKKVVERLNAGASLLLEVNDCLPNQQKASQSIIHLLLEYSFGNLQFNSS
jgi:hypothetical protein